MRAITTSITGLKFSKVSKFKLCTTSHRRGGLMDREGLALLQVEDFDFDVIFYTWCS